MLILLAHACPGISYHDISVLGCLKRVIHQLDGCAGFLRILAGILKNLHIRLKALRIGRNKINACLGAAVHVGIGHVVAIAYIGHLQALEILALVLLNSQQVSQNLARMQKVSQGIDNRHVRPFSKLLHPVMAKGANHDAVQITGHNTGSILDRLAPAQLQITVGQKQCLTAQLIHTCFKGKAGTGGRFLKNHAQSLALQDMMLNAGLLLCLELVAQSQDFIYLIHGKVMDGKHVLAF